MLIAGPSLLILLLAVYLSAKSKQPPMDHDVILRIRGIADQMRREDMLPFE